MIAAMARCRASCSSGRTGSRLRAAAFDFASRREMTAAGRTAAAQLARRPGAASGQRRRLRQSVPRGTGAARSDRRRRASSPRPRTGWRSSTGITATRPAAAISSPPTTPTALIARAQDRRRLRRPGRQRHAGRRAGAARDPDRRRPSIAVAPKRSSRPFRASSRAISSRSRPCSTTPSCWPSRCRSSSSARLGDPAVRGSAPQAAFGVSLPNRVVSSAGPRATALPEGHPAYGKGLVDGRCGRLCLRWPGVLVAADRSRRNCSRISPNMR